MSLTATKTPTGYLVEGKDAVGKDVEIFYDSRDTANYDYLVEAVDSFHKNEKFQEGRRKIRENDPERKLYLDVFGADEVQTDPVLHTALVEPIEARDGLAVDWSQHPVTVVLRLIDQGQSNRIRLINGQLVDMGAPVKKPAAKKAPAKKAAASKS